MKTVELLNFVLVIKYSIQNPNDVQSESFNILGLASLPVKPKRPRWFKIQASAEYLICHFSF